MIIAGFDIATTTGICILDGDTLVHASSYRSRGETDAEIFRDFRCWFTAMLTLHGKIKKVAVEQPLRTPSITDTGELSPKSNMGVYLRLYGLRAHALEICEALNIEHFEVNLMTWRADFLGNGHADKEACKKYVNDVLGLKIKSLDACEAVGVAWWLLGKVDPFRAGKTGDMLAAAE